MRALIQRVSRASVSCDDGFESEIGQGYLILLGVGAEDDQETCARLWTKIHKLRIFKDDAGKTNLDLASVGGQVMVISQFTLFADTKKGNRPSFVKAAPPDKGQALYDYFLDLARRDVDKVARGSFGADMQVSLVNDGPFTIWLDTDLF